MAPLKRAPNRTRKKASTSTRPRVAQAPIPGGTKALCSHCGNYLHPTTVWRHESQRDFNSMPLAVATLPPRERRQLRQPSPELLPTLTAEELALSPLGSLELELTASNRTSTPPAPDPSEMLAHLSIADDEMDRDMDIADDNRDMEDDGHDIEATLWQQAGLDGIVDPGRSDSAQGGDSPILSRSTPASSRTSSSSSSSSSSSTDDELEWDLAPGGLAQQRPNISAILPPPLPLESNLALYMGRRRINRPIQLHSPEYAAIRAYKLQIEINLGSNAFAKLLYTFPELSGIPSLKALRGLMQSMSGLKPQMHDCCINVCICYAGAFAAADACPYCHKPRFRPDGRTARRQFTYLPIIPQLQAMYANKKTASAMRYRHQNHRKHATDPTGKISDIYHSSHYQNLLLQPVVVNGQELGHYYFDQPQDVLLINMTDGFRLFKRGRHSSWPLIFINANLSPELRYHVNNVICVTLIPGPNKPKNFDSFFSVVVAELETGALGVPTYNAEIDAMCDMHFYGPFGGGDMPAVAMAYTGCKQHSAKHPCRECPIEGIRPPGSRNPVYYAPIRRPDGYLPLANYNLSHPPRRKHGAFLAQARLVDDAPTVAERRRCSTLYGINGTPITVRIPGVRFPDSFPFDFMHLMENMLSNYVLHLCGEFKGLDAGIENYILNEATWKEIGRATVEANRTIPSGFGRRIPNISEDRSFFTAEAYVVWWTLYAPILLRNRFAQPRYYAHFMLFISILNRCLAFSSTKLERDELRVDIVNWYKQYERIFYQYDATRLSACLMTVHAWLHLVDLIEESGPLWSYWCWIMERFCGRLSWAISSRKHPYASLDRRVLELQTLAMMKNLYGLNDQLPDYTMMHDPSFQSSFTHKDYSEIILRHAPQTLNLRAGETRLRSLRDRIAVHLATQFGTTTARIKRILPATVVQWGKVSIVDGDTINTSLGYKRKEDNLRDATFCQYEQLADVNARRRRAPIVFRSQDFYGQLELAIVCKLPSTPDLGIPDGATKILLDIWRCETTDDRNGIPEYITMGRHETVDANSLRVAVGRIKDRGKWAIVKRFGGHEHAEYLDIDFGAS